jgi:hypothetical protein
MERWYVERKLQDEEGCVEGHDRFGGFEQALHLLSPA